MDSISPCTKRLKRALKRTLFGVKDAVRLEYLRIVAPESAMIVPEQTSEVGARVESSEEIGESRENRKSGAGAEEGVGAGSDTDGGRTVDAGEQQWGEREVVTVSEGEKGEKGEGRAAEVADDADDRVRVKAGYDLYTRIFFLQLLSFLYLVLFFQKTSLVLDAFKQTDTLSGSYVLVLFFQFTVIVLDRICYLVRSGGGKLGLQMAYLLIVVFWSRSDFGLNMFGLSTVRLLFWYLLQIPYLYYSALQLCYGYPFNVYDQWLMRKEHWLWGMLFTWYKAIPFMYEMRVLLDWTCSSTTLRYNEWIKLEDIRSSLFVTACNLQYYKADARPKGTPEPMSRKIT